jgi:hypothetical protein
LSIPTRLKILYAALLLPWVIVLVIAGVYQKHLRFLLTDFSKATPPATRLAFPAPDVKAIEHPLVLDGVQLPFAEDEIRSLKTRERSPAVVIELASGVMILLHPTERGRGKIENLQEGMAWDLACRDDFRWSMTSDEIQQLEDRILDRGGEIEVQGVGWREETQWRALVRRYAPNFDIHEIEWITADEKWGGILQVKFKNSPELSTDATKQLEFLSQFIIVSPPQGNYAEELAALIERVRAKQPQAIEEAK